MPRDYARCHGSPDHLDLCVGCARYVKNNDDPPGERVSYHDFKPVPIHKLSGIKWLCAAKINVRPPDAKWWSPT